VRRLWWAEIGMEGVLIHLVTRILVKRVLVFHEWAAMGKLYEL
jgi:hypothetical protein